MLTIAINFLTFAVLYVAAGTALVLCASATVDLQYYPKRYWTGIRNIIIAAALLYIVWHFAFPR
jgi:heme/copper-type cytochrome/quinol oxidase subunit 1